MERAKFSGTRLRFGPAGSPGTPFQPRRPTVAVGNVARRRQGKGGRPRSHSFRQKTKRDRRPKTERRRKSQAWTSDDTTRAATPIRMVFARSGASCSPSTPRRTDVRPPATIMAWPGDQARPCSPASLRHRAGVPVKANSPEALMILPHSTQHKRRRQISGSCSERPRRISLRYLSLASCRQHGPIRGHIANSEAPSYH